jgi:hypothetical protein
MMFRLKGIRRLKLNKKNSNFKQDFINWANSQVASKSRFPGLVKPDFHHNGCFSKRSNMPLMA